MAGTAVMAAGLPRDAGEGSVHIMCSSGDTSFRGWNEGRTEQLRQAEEDCGDGGCVGEEERRLLRVAEQDNP